MARADCDARYYAKNKRTQQERVARRKREIAAWVKNLKIGRQCERCGYDHPAALDWHHRPGEEKLFSVCKAPERGAGRTKILAEVAKCELICANCHRVEHFSVFFPDHAPEA